MSLPCLASEHFSTTSENTTRKGGFLQTKGAWMSPGPLWVARLLLVTEAGFSDAVLVSHGLDLREVKIRYQPEGRQHEQSRSADETRRVPDNCKDEYRDYRS